MALLDVDQLAEALAGMSYPARRWKMAAWADINCASSELREAMRHLPDQEYATADHLYSTLNEIERRSMAILSAEPAPQLPVARRACQQTETPDLTAAVLPAQTARIRRTATVG